MFLRFSSASGSILNPDKLNTLIEFDSFIKFIASVLVKSKLSLLLLISIRCSKLLSSFIFFSDFIEVQFPNFIVSVIKLLQ